MGEAAIAHEGRRVPGLAHYLFNRSKAQRYTSKLGEHVFLFGVDGELLEKFPNLEGIKLVKLDTAPRQVSVDRFVPLGWMSVEEFK